MTGLAGFYFKWTNKKYHKAGLEYFASYAVHWPEKTRDNGAAKTLIQVMEILMKDMNGIKRN